MAPAPPPGEAVVGPDGLPIPQAPTENSNEVATVTLTFCGVNVAGVSGQPQANMGIAYDVLKELQESPLFNKEATKTSTDVTLDEQTGTFTFSIVARMKHPLKL